MLITSSLTLSALFLTNIYAVAPPKPSEEAVIPAQNTVEIDKVNIRLEGIREKCLVEELPEKTVVLGILYYN